MRSKNEEAAFYHAEWSKLRVKSQKGKNEKRKHRGHRAGAENTEKT